MKIKHGSKVTLDYEGRFESGEVFDSSKHGDHSHPLVFNSGEGHVIKGFDDAVSGMSVGEEKEFKILPKDAYGEFSEELLQEIPRQALPPEQEPQVGMALMMRTPQGDIPVMISEVKKDSVVLNLNHPLAGKTLIFKIKILKVE